ncbi:MAG: hypothetical protein HQM16_02390 [Deltaproteobacteria bacterium]|nr:hypothetical protein [Deltaproteobacteria bacterium]
MAEKTKGNANVNTISRAQKAALIFLLLEEKGVARLFDYMSDEDIKKLGNILLGMGEIPIASMNEVLTEFHNDLGIEAGQMSGEKLYNKLVSKSLPEERKGRILKIKNIKGGKGSKQNPLESMFDELSPDQIYSLIQDEHPQTIAVILSLIKPMLSSLVIKKMEKKPQADCLYRMSVLSKVPEDLINFLADNYRNKLASGDLSTGAAGKKKAVEVEGSDHVLRYVKGLDWTKAEEVIAQIEKKNPKVAAVLRKKFFTMEDLKRADGHGVRALLRSVEMASLSLALKGQPTEIQDLFFSNMSTRAATLMREDMEVMREQKAEDVEAAVDAILEEAKKLIMEGQMALAPLADD